MFFIRAARPSDLDDLHAVSEHLDSVNLPSDREGLGAIIARSTRSFGASVDAARREFTFVLVERPQDGRERVIGCSMIFAQHGSRRAPHVYFDVIEEERYSETLDKLFVHRLLRIGYNYKGVTEIGGLAILPEYRTHPLRLGRLLSFVRFLFIARHRPLFRDEIVAELMPPLEGDGRSLLWESLGHRFTGLSYQEADRLSRENKEFIKALFPQSAIYASLLSPEAQALIGQVGPATKGVEHMLRKIGFRYANRIDPFDGGPHFHAATDEVGLVKATRVLTVATANPAEPRSAIVAVDGADDPYFFAIETHVGIDGGTVVLAAETASRLDVHPGSRVVVLPL